MVSSEAQRTFVGDAHNDDNENQKMTRGAQRDRNRERTQKEQASKESHKREGPRYAGVNADADALQKKIEEKKKLVEAGVLPPPDTEKKKKKEVLLTHPISGKKDAEYTAKMKAKGLA